MSAQEQIQNAYKKSKSYPELVKNLIDVGIECYTVDVATSTILYRLSQGQTILHAGNTPAKTITPLFDKNAVIQAVRDNQQGKSDYSGFMHAIANAGVYFYEATLIGPNKRVTYISNNGYYEEPITI